MWRLVIHDSFLGNESVVLFAGRTIAPKKTKLVEKEKLQKVSGLQFYCVYRYIIICNKPICTRSAIKLATNCFFGD